MRRTGGARSTGAFWRTTALDQLSDDEWESLCDGCGKCCLHKLEDEDTGEILFTRVACRLLEISRCRCSDYENRLRRVPECLDVRRHMDKLSWLPSTCAYRLLGEGLDLPPWHPLVCGEPSAVHRAGVSVRDYALPEEQIDRVEDYVVEGLS